MMAGALDLVSLFSTLATTVVTDTTGTTMIACRIPGYAHHRLAKDAGDAPVLLVSVGNSYVEPRPIPFALEHLSVQHDVECLVTHRDGSQESGRFCVIRCTNADAPLRTYFLRTLETVVVLLGDNPSQSDVSQAIGRLVELFRLMTEPSRGSVQGLWAELVLISAASDPAAMVSAWHAAPTDLYDFGADGHRIEVKSTRVHSRRHHFSLAQLQGIGGLRVLIASIVAESAGSGVSIADLVREISSRIDSTPRLVAKLDDIVGLSLGGGWRCALEAGFDYDLAISSLAFFESVVVPTVDPNLPPGVSNVHFEADLDGLPSVSFTQLRAAGGLFSAAVPLC